MTSLKPLEPRELIARELEAARTRTLALFDLASEEDLRQSPGFGFRPVLWHLAHIGVFEAYWLLQKLGGEPAPDERYERIFDPIATPREESKNLPARREMEAYLARVRARVLTRLAETNFDAADPLTREGYIFRLVVEHERQHQETLAYLLHLLAPEKKSRPRARGSRTHEDAAQGPVPQTSPARRIAAGGMAVVPAGEFQMGSLWDSFAYDNELPSHTVMLPAFRIDRFLTTNAEYAEFIAGGGYRRRELWSGEGWEWREREGWERPLYWTQDAGVWRVRGMFDKGPVEPDHPVTSVSWHEAEAYARFRGKRLPTENEWEKAASWDAARSRKRRFAWGDDDPNHALCNFDLERWGTTPVGSFADGASAYGCFDMTGNVWEWTSTPFAGFQNFTPFPYPEYSQAWFDGDHRVLKGGSWATAGSVLRTSFRNFFRRQFRIAFAGIRLASNA